MSNSNNSSSGIGCGGVIFIVLLILKLFGFINISWWWVFSPLLFGLAITIILLIIFVITIKK